MNARQRSTRAVYSFTLQVAPLWFLAQLTFNASLRLTSVTSNTILSSASALFTFLFSLALLAERFTLRKLACIGLLMAGTAMVTLADAGGGASSASSGESSVAGDMLCLLSAVVYGGYTVALRRLLGEDEGVAMTLFFGMMGGVIFCVVGPTLCVLRLLGVGLGALSWRGFGLMVAKGLLDNVLSDYLWARAILLVGEAQGMQQHMPTGTLLPAALRRAAPRCDVRH
jgi:solute carrier family 35 protein F5